MHAKKSNIIVGDTPAAEVTVNECSVVEACVIDAIKVPLNAYPFGDSYRLNLVMEKWRREKG